MSGWFHHVAQLWMAAILFWGVYTNDLMGVVLAMGTILFIEVTYQNRE